MSTYLRFGNHNGEVAFQYYLDEADPQVKTKYLGKDGECDSDCETTKTQVTADISRVQEETESKMNYEIEKTERESAARRRFKEQMLEANEIHQQVGDGSKDKQVALNEIEELRKRSTKAIIDDPEFSDSDQRNALLRSMYEGYDVFEEDLKTTIAAMGRTRPGSTAHRQRAPRPAG